MTTNGTIRKWLLLAFSPLLYFSCTPDSTLAPTGTMNAYVPVYANLDSVAQISVQQPKPVQQPGEVYAYGHYVFQNDLNTGIHITDISDKSHPQKIAFLKLPLNTEMAIKNNFLYANNYRDIIVFDITDPANPKMIKRIPNVYSPVSQQYPPYTGVYFQCTDPSKGVVVRWELETIKTPNCRR